MVSTTSTPRRESADQTTARRFDKAEIEQADRQLAAAFAQCGLIDEGNLVCPTCHTSARKKVEIKTSRETGRTYWKCYKCPDAWGGSAIELVMTHGPVSTFPEAVALLLGREVKGKDGKPVKPVDVPRIEISAAFTATVAWELYDRIRDAGSLEAAQAYYATWHIAPEAVAESGSTQLLDATGLQKQLVAEFGIEELRQAGLVTADKNGRDVFLFQQDYNVIEPHTAPSGHVVGMQFRPSAAHSVKVRAHKAWKKKWSGQLDEDGTEIEPGEAWRRAYEKDQGIEPKARYVTPFLSLRGAGTDHLVGCGLPRLVRIPEGSTVYIVEGFKDLLAARTLGLEAYAIPGTGVMPPERAVQILRRHKVIVTLDGDDAGANGREALTAYLAERGVDVTAGSLLRPDMDVADVLVERNAHAGCSCATCSAWRDSHPWDPQTCPCRTCRAARSA